MSASLPSGGAFKRQVIGLSYWFSVPALAIIAAALASLLEVTSALWSEFWIVVAVYAVAISPVSSRAQVQFLDPISIYLDAVRSKDATPEQARAAYARAVDLPRFSALMGIGGWLVPVSLISVWMELRWSVWTAYETAILLISGVAAGFVAGSFLMLMSKRAPAPISPASRPAKPRPPKDSQGTLL